MLGIDTSTRWAGVGLLDATGVKYERTWRSERNHGRELLPAVEELFEEAKLSVRGLTHIAVALGPGGFSAVRVGMSAALGLAAPRDTPLVGISTHAVEAAPFIDRSGPGTPLYSALPAGRGEVAWARFEGSPEAVETGVASPEELSLSLTETAMVCGESAGELVRHLPTGAFVGSMPPTRSPGTLLSLALTKIEDGELTSSTALKPIYARPPSISQPKPPA